MDAKIARGSKRAELLIRNFGNAANVQTENAPSRTLQNYQQLNLEELDRDLNPADLKKDDGEGIKKNKEKKFEPIQQLSKAAERKRGGAEPPTTSVIKPLISAALRVNVVLFCEPVGRKCAAGGDYVAQPFQKSHLSLLPHDPPASQRFYSDGRTRLHLQEEEKHICTLGFVVLMSRFKLVRLPSSTNTEQCSKVKA